MALAISIFTLVSILATIYITIGNRKKANANEETVANIHVLVNSRLSTALTRIKELEKVLDARPKQ